jgi:hypothetical protein
MGASSYLAIAGVGGDITRLWRREHTIIHIIIVGEFSLEGKQECGDSPFQAGSGRFILALRLLPRYDAHAVGKAKGAP